MIYAWNFIVSFALYAMKTLSSCSRFWYKFSFLIRSWYTTSTRKKYGMHSFRLVKVREVVAAAWIVTVRRHMPNSDHFYSRFTFSVLVFPPVNNYRRFLIHKVSEKYPEELGTFSIGQGHGRRTVVCFKRDLLR